MIWSRCRRSDRHGTYYIIVVGLVLKLFHRHVWGRVSLKNKKGENTVLAFMNVMFIYIFFVEDVGSNYLIEVSGSKKGVRENENRKERRERLDSSEI